MSTLIAETKGVANKVFALVDTLCDKNLSNPLPECQSVVNQFGKYLNDKIADMKINVAHSVQRH